eukprot:1328507-Pleurochrysis_carterae.AAC.4
MLSISSAPLFAMADEGFQSMAEGDENAVDVVAAEPQQLPHESALHTPDDLLLAAKPTQVDHRTCDEGLS